MIMLQLVVFLINAALLYASKNPEKKCPP